MIGKVLIAFLILTLLVWGFGRAVKFTASLPLSDKWDMLKFSLCVAASGGTAAVILFFVVQLF